MAVAIICGTRHSLSLSPRPSFNLFKHVILKSRNGPKDEAMSTPFHGIFESLLARVLYAIRMILCQDCLWKMNLCTRYVSLEYMYTYGSIMF